MPTVDPLRRGTAEKSFTAPAWRLRHTVGWLAINDEAAVGALVGVRPRAVPVLYGAQWWRYVEGINNERRCWKQCVESTPYIRRYRRREYPLKRISVVHARSARRRDLIVSWLSMVVTDAATRQTTYVPICLTARRFRGMSPSRLSYIKRDAYAHVP